MGQPTPSSSAKLICSCKGTCGGNDWTAQVIERGLPFWTLREPSRAQDCTHNPMARSAENIASVQLWLLLLLSNHGHSVQLLRTAGFIARHHMKRHSRVDTAAALEQTPWAVCAAGSRCRPHQLPSSRYFQ
ncbi:hypothetical protein HPB52_006046 [Rhipicephalus sanguineus]|uniref:Uncharacterized protein n=1 Tax=Rhipicephalus sanguineus TaxID=34632 RepID=A0A9D4T8P1_RHISA|nr:hypothetical protein HPB52_006046 [Rhipicephalus sanguineus]